MSTPFQRGTTVLLVMSEQDPVLEGIQRQLEQLRVVVRQAMSLQEYLQFMRQSLGREQVVISGVSLPDGNWCDVLTATVRAGSPARVVVCSQTADERFWSEAIWRGVHDILVEPFTVEYLRRCVEPRSGSDREGEPEDPAARRRESDKRPGMRRVNSTAAMVALA